MKQVTDLAVGILNTPINELEDKAMTCTNEIKSRFEIAAAIGGMTLYAALVALSVFSEMVI